MVHMDITPYVDRLRADLTAAAAAGGEPVRDAAERLSLALDPAMRLGLMEVLSEAAAEITSAMRTGSVETRLAGRDIEFVLDQSATTAPPTEDTATTETDEGDLARRRYKLTSTVPALRDREIVSVAGYQRLFREYIAGHMNDPDPLRAELMAAAVASAHNHVLRRWLRGDTVDPVREIDEAMRQVAALFTLRAPGSGADGTTVIAFRTAQPLETILPAIRHVLDQKEVNGPA